LKFALNCIVKEDIIVGSILRKLLPTLSFV